MFKPQLKSPLRNSIMRALLAGNSTTSVPSFYFNFSNQQNVTLGAAQARGTITSTQNAHITMSASLSRVVGVAPLYVNIDMTGTTSDLTTNATHDLFYSVNWGDPGAGQWANGVQSAGLTDKNWSFGPVGGHVFETPGTYLVTPTSTDGVNSAAKPGYVTVLDPNVVYAPAYGAGYETICISNSNNFTGAPGTGALPGVATYINRSGDTDMYAAWIAHKASKKRILFCKADSWTISATIPFAGLSNMIVGGYGTGVAATFGSGTMVSAAAALSASPVFSSDGGSDIRLCNIRLDANAKVAVKGTASDDFQMTYYKLEMRNAYCAFSLTPNFAYNSLFKREQTCIYECLHDEAYGIGGDPPQSLGATASNGGGVTPCVFTATGHYFKRVNKVRLVGTPPTGFATATDYYISATNLTANTFSLTASATVDTPIASTSTGTCDVMGQSEGGGQGLYIALTKGGIMGCYFDNCNRGEQTVRFPYIHTSHFNNNYLARPNQTKNILKVGSRGYENIKDIPGVSGWSEKFIISANFMDLRGGYSYGDVSPVTGRVATQVGNSSITIRVGSPTEGPNEFLRNCIVENNYTQTCLGSPKDSHGFIDVGIPNVTVRNNIFDASVGTVGDRFTAFDGNYANTYMCFGGVSSSTKDTTTGVRFYNNTMYSNLRNAERAEFINVQGPPKNTVTGAVGAPGIFTSTVAHEMYVGDRVRLVGTPPTGFATGTDYFVTATNFAATTFTLSASSGGSALPISVGGTCYSYKALDVDDLKIQNNVWYLPQHAAGNSAIGAMFLGGNPVAAPTNVVQTPNTNTVQNARVSPGFVTTPPRAGYLDDWRTTGYPNGSGAAVPVLRDFTNMTRVGTGNNMGAVLP